MEAALFKSEAAALCAPASPDLHWLKQVADRTGSVQMLSNEVFPGSGNKLEEGSN